MTKQIPLDKGKFALVDDEDYEWLLPYKWRAIKSRCTFYARAHPHKLEPRLHMHRLIMGVSDDRFVDHINHDGLDNRKENLRIVTHQQNGCNQRKTHGISKYKGVTFDKTCTYRPWMAQIKVNQKHIRLGSFFTEWEAAHAYDEASLKYHGEYGERNFSK